MPSFITTNRNPSHVYTLQEDLYIAPQTLLLHSRSSAGIAYTFINNQYSVCDETSIHLPGEVVSVGPVIHKDLIIIITLLVAVTYWRLVVMDLWLLGV